MVLNVITELRVNPTEDQLKLESILRKLLPGEIKEDPRSDGLYLYIRAKGNESLDFFKNWIHDMQLIDTVRQKFLHNIEYGTIATIYFNRQAAYVDRLALLDFDDQPPLGPVMFQIIADSEEQLFEVIDQIVPSTIEGKVMTEKEKKEYFRKLEEKRKAIKRKKEKKAKEYREDFEEIDLSGE